MRRIVLASFLSLAVAPAVHAQDEPVVLVLDAGASGLDADAVGRTIAGALARPVVRMTDARAPVARGQLSIAFTSPDQWVLRYESGGEVAWASERIARAEGLESRLATLTRGLVDEVELQTRSWSEDVALALRSEIIDPFRNLPRPAPSAELRLSDLLDPFETNPRRLREHRSWSEVLDPWAPSR